MLLNQIICLIFLVFVIIYGSYRLIKWLYKIDEIKISDNWKPYKNGVSPSNYKEYNYYNRRNLRF